MIQYIILAIILTYCFFILYFKIKYKFWSRQPVFHYHNLWYWLFPPGIIEHIPPKKEKFFDRSIITTKFDSLTKYQKNSVFNLIHTYYLRDKDVHYSPNKNAVLSYLINHSHPSIISLFYKKKPLFDISNQQSIISKKLVSVMTSRILNCHLSNQDIFLNYVDYLCVDKNYRKKGIAPKVIYTHCSRVRNNSKNLIFLFKRETSLTSIVPLTTYYTYGFDTKYWKYGVRPMVQYPHLIITSQNFHLFYHLMEKIKKYFTCTIYPSFSHIQYLIKQKLIFIYIILHKDEPIACYFFRNPFTFYKKNNIIGNSIDCFASFFDKEKLNHVIFSYYFHLSLFKIQQFYQFKFILIENISDNNFIIQNIFERYTPIIKCPTAYYFYNFAYRPQLSDKIFIVN